MHQGAPSVLLTLPEPLFAVNKFVLIGWVVQKWSILGSTPLNESHSTLIPKIYLDIHSSK